MDTDIRDVASLAELVADKDLFLAAPGIEVDADDMACVLGEAADPEEDPSSRFFDHVVFELGGRETIVLHRHMTVGDVEAFVASVRAGTAGVGAHWSTDPSTWSEHGEVGDDVVISGEIDAAGVDWFTTFQLRLAHPSEAEVVFEGPVRVSTIRRMDDDATWDLGGLPCDAVDRRATPQAPMP